MIMINYNNLMSKFEEIAPNVSEDIRLDWLENAEVVIGNDLDSREIFSSDEERNRKVEQGIYSAMNKLRGITNSDIGPLYLNYIGEYSFRTAEEIVREKLCSKHPEPLSENVIRFIETKEHAEKKFLIKMKNYNLRPFGAIEVNIDNKNAPLSTPRDENGKSLLPSSGSAFKTKDQIALDNMFGESFHGDKVWEEHPWVRKNLSSNLYIDSLNGELWLIKYSCPKNHDIVEAMQDSLPESHKAQLLLDKIKLEEAFARMGEEIEIEHVAVVPFSMEKWDVYPVEFDPDPVMEGTIMDAGDYYWECIQNHKIPKFESDKIYKRIENELLDEDMIRQNAEYILLKRTIADATKKADGLKNAIEERAARFGINTTDEGHKTRFGGIDLTTRVKSTVNIEKLKEVFIAEGGDINNDLLWDVTSKPKVTEMKKLMKENSVPPESYQITGTKKTDTDLLVACYENLGGKMDDERYFKITRKFDGDALRALFVVQGGRLDDERIIDNSISPTISVIRQKEYQGNDFIGEIDEVAKELIQEGLSILPEITEKFIEQANVRKRNISQSMDSSNENNIEENDNKENKPAKKADSVEDDSLSYF